MSIEFGQAKDFFNLLLNPFVVRDRIFSLGDEQALQETLKRMVESVKSLKIQASLDVRLNMIQCVLAELAGC